MNSEQQSYQTGLGVIMLNRARIIFVIGFFVFSSALIYLLYSFFRSGFITNTQKAWSSYQAELAKEMISSPYPTVAPNQMDNSTTTDTINDTTSTSNGAAESSQHYTPPTPYPTYVYPTQPDYQAQYQQNTAKMNQSYQQQVDQMNQQFQQQVQQNNQNFQNTQKQYQDQYNQAVQQMQGSMTAPK